MRLTIWSVATVWALLLTGCAMRMPGVSHSGGLPEATAAQRALAEELRADVHVLACDIGRRNIEHLTGLARAEAYLVAELGKAGYTVERQTVSVNGVACSNLIAELRGDTRHR